ncbi:VanZ domain protein [Purpureocillium lavendulum]|uniref:VanZ domain protein n=1 Tax=Purpureocillium lavendulum TaxID=1247861 RepID=A0AB34FT31_9HYPO|nr:VanZ domain protein [Purpureocillium lavendulum]
MEKTARKVPSARPNTENQERAYIAASRRTDRSLEARVQSARMASDIHKQRTGKHFRITEEIVMNEEMYEEEEDKLPRSFRVLAPHLMTASPDINGRLHDFVENKYQMAHLLANTNDHWRKENEINKMFALSFPHASQQAEHLSHSMSQTMFQTQQQPQSQPHLQAQPPQDMIAGAPSPYEPQCHHSFGGPHSYAAPSPFSAPSPFDTTQSSHTPSPVPRRSTFLSSVSYIPRTKPRNRSTTRSVSRSKSRSDRQGGSSRAKAQAPTPPNPGSQPDTPTPMMGGSSFDSAMDAGTPGTPSDVEAAGASIFTTELPPEVKLLMGHGVNHTDAGANWGHGSCDHEWPTAPTPYQGQMPMEHGMDFDSIDYGSMDYGSMHMPFKGGDVNEAVAQSPYDEDDALAGLDVTWEQLIDSSAWNNESQ